MIPARGKMNLARVILAKTVVFSPQTGGITTITIRKGG
jgi:multidrug resistance efflux pump